MSYCMFDYLVLNVNFFGFNVIFVVGECCQLLGGKKVLLVIDKGLWVIKDGVVDKILYYLWEVGIEVVIFDGVELNLKDINVCDGFVVFCCEQCDIIVIVGGGSLYDCGKGIGIVVIYEGDLYQYVGIEILINLLLFIVVVNIIVGIVSEVICYCVLINIEIKVKFVIVSWCNLLLVFINDLLLMIGKLVVLIVVIGMDVLIYVVEVYIFKDVNLVMDVVVMQVICFIVCNLCQVVVFGSNLQVWENMVYVFLLVGMVFNNVNFGYVYVMVYQLGGLYDMLYGVVNVVLLLYVVCYNLIVNLEKFVDIVELMGENIIGLFIFDVVEKVIVVIMCLLMDIGILQYLCDLGVKEVDFFYMVEMVLKDGNVFLNLCKGNEQEIVVIFCQVF